ncbi:tyrosine protein kinase [Paenibacillus polymyxa]|uniref:Tyrosine protein kinase n=1 Tax=Paenibacillus polymyxa TaxID=1406 RepID=A0A8I1J4R9_PAEPO|nr:MULTISPECIES: tyrosine protein kinase [Paenibacillus]KAF6570169.1 tyrosine protein kinase [Paenibacillus sp. EKM206P]KAF6585562.1 tyrosine protein kinase [Paenibacillus sp. EKM205P]MBM0635569.1 tyrosine protein kinase [Paenibacillus polymyxa]MDY8094997.1 tyrosine protein kinase [Paenibacillus polymyxa]
MPGHYYHRRAQTRAISDPYSSSPYPGLDPYSEVPQVDSSALVPYEAPASITDSAVVTPDPAPAKGGLLGGLGNLGNLNDIKGIIDRMGGIDGIVATVGKVQKIMSSVQQFAPMAKLIMGSLPAFNKNASKKSTTQITEELDEYTPPRRRRKKTQRKSTTTPRRRPRKRTRK